MTPPPHPQRCETCKHRLPDCDKEDLGSRICKKIFLEDPRALQIGIPYFIDIVGCASHSSTHSSPAAAPVPSARRWSVNSAPTPSGGLNFDIFYDGEHIGIAFTKEMAEYIAECVDRGYTLKDHDEQIRQEAAAKERERVLDAGLLYRLVYWAVIFRDKNNRLPTGEESVKWVLESLRGEQPEHQP